MADFRQVGFVSKGPNKYMATYRFDESEPFFILTKDGTEEAIIFETAIEATRAAMERIKLQRQVEERPEREAFSADVLGLAAWREAKARELAETKLIIRTGDFRPFKVEVKRKRKVNGGRQVKESALDTSGI